MTFADKIQIFIAIFTAFAAFSAAVSLFISHLDRKRKYKPQFEIITNEDDNLVLNIVNLNPNYQSYEIIEVTNRSNYKSLSFEKQLTELNGGLNILKIHFNYDFRLYSDINVIEIKYRSIIQKTYKEAVKIKINKQGNTTEDIKGLVFKKL